MSIVEEPGTGLHYVELSHPFKHDMPTVPGYADVLLWRAVTHAKHGVMSHKVKMQMHTGTHVNAPIHLVQGGAGIGDLELNHFFGNGVVIGLDKNEWERISADDLKSSTNPIETGDFVIINTGWHKRYADSQEYFGHGPGLMEDAADFLIEKKVKLVGIDTPFVDHPLATSMVGHRNGPQIRRLAEHYKEATGREALDDFPDWNPAHRALLRAGIPTVENVGGDVDAVTGGRCTFHAMPWRWSAADACMIRLVAIMDPSGQYQLESGEHE